MKEGEGGDEIGKAKDRVTSCVCVCVHPLRVKIHSSSRSFPTPPLISFPWPKTAAAGPLLRWRSQKQ